nr:hypothetical protein [uncultured Rhizobium sp.]
MTSFVCVPIAEPILRFLNRRIGIVSLAAGLAGCSRNAAAPLPIVGAYFPLWLLSAIAGIAGAIITRVIFISIGLDAILRFRLAVYLSIATVIGTTICFGCV